MKKGSDISKIRTVLSHPQPLGQCRKFLAEHLPDAVIKAAHSTAAAAGEVAAGTGDTAALGSRAAAEVYGLEILKEDIQDHDNNYTRFIVLGRSDADRTGNDTTSLIFSTEDKPKPLQDIANIQPLGRKHDAHRVEACQERAWQLHILRGCPGAQGRRGSQGCPDDGEKENIIF